MRAKKWDGRDVPLIEVLSDAEIICNGILQDTDNPTMFIGDNELCRLTDRAVIIDTNCDRAMGYPFAESTLFDSPVVRLERGITYYSVDHTPSYFWNAASREISKAVTPFLDVVGRGPSAWEKDETIRRAIEIQDGIVKNEKILTFQKRESCYPFRKKDPDAQ